MESRSGCSFQWTRWSAAQLYSREWHGMPRYSKVSQFCFCCCRATSLETRTCKCFFNMPTWFAALITKPLAESHARSLFDFSRSVEVISGWSNPSSAFPIEVRAFAKRTMVSLSAKEFVTKRNDEQAAWALSFNCYFFSRAPIEIVFLLSLSLASSLCNTKKKGFQVS
jgi:hypothetical protein